MSEGGVVVDDAFFAGVDEGGEEGAVGGFVAAFDMIGNGGDVHGADPVADGAVDFEVFADEGDACAVGAREETLTEDADHLMGEEGEHDGSVFRGDEIGEPVEGFGDVRAVECGDDEVACFCGLEAGDGGVAVADFAEEDDVRGLAEGFLEA